MRTDCDRAFVSISRHPLVDSDLLPTVGFSACVIERILNFGPDAQEALGVSLARNSVGKGHSLLVPSISIWLMFGVTAKVERAVAFNLVKPVAGSGSGSGSRSSINYGTDFNFPSQVSTVRRTSSSV